MYLLSDFLLWLYTTLLLFSFLTWVAAWQNQQNDWPAQLRLRSACPGHPPSLIRVFAVHMKNPWVISFPLSAQRRQWSDWADAQAYLSLCWVHRWFCCFCCVQAHTSDRIVLSWRFVKFQGCYKGGQIFKKKKNFFCWSWLCTSLFMCLKLIIWPHHECFSYFCGSLQFASAPNPHPLWPTNQISLHSASVAKMSVTYSSDWVWHVSQCRLSPTAIIIMIIILITILSKEDYIFSPQTNLTNDPQMIYSQWRISWDHWNTIDLSLVFIISELCYW